MKEASSAQGAGSKPLGNSSFLASFSVDASHVDRLGRELVARQDTALAELIKNGYDADATDAIITFYPSTEDRPSRAEIEDDGNGMTRADVVGGFMRISTQDKAKHPTSPRLHRSRAGRKGIGRFAAQRLARRLIVITRSRLDHGEPGLRLEIDWEQYTANLDIQDIPILVVIDNSAPFGTRLILEDLRDDWTESDVSEVAESLAPLIQPPVPGRVHPADSTAFSFSLVGPSGKTYTPDDSFQALAREAVATIHARVNDQGIPTVHVTSDRVPGANQSEHLSQASSKALANVTLTAYYFIQNKEWLPQSPSERRTVREALRRFGGIRVYRNGFRVAPYGEPSDDWAQLDAEYRKRGALLAPIGNQNFIGAVEVHDPDGVFFQETSSREGLIENTAFKELRQFVFRACFEAARIISEARGIELKRRRGSASQSLKQQVSNLQATVSRFLSAADDDERATIGQLLVNLSGGIVSSATVLETAQIDENSMLRVLSTMGMAVAEFVHEIRMTVSYASGDLNDLLNANFAEPTKSRLSRLRENLSVLAKYTDYFSAVITSNESRALRPVSADRVFRVFEQFADAMLKGKNIKLDVKVEGYGVNSQPMHDAEWLSILSNFLSNSTKALEHAEVEQAEICVRAFKDGGQVVIQFADNGVGIPRRNWTRVFDAFFTTTVTDMPRAAGNADAVAGMGLGLKIVKDIVESNSGTVSVVEPPPGFTTCIEVRLPRAGSAK